MENEVKLYHKEVAWDNYFDYVCRKLLSNLNVVVTEHANERFIEKDIDKGYVLTLLNFGRKGEIFEVEKQGKFIEKFVIRMAYDLKNDVCIVLRVHFDEETNRRYLIIPTVWLNCRDDKHFTLDETKYEKIL
jgi:hypothetical protein